MFFNTLTVMPRASCYMLLCLIFFTPNVVVATTVDECKLHCTGCDGHDGQGNVNVTTLTCHSIPPTMTFFDWPLTTLTFEGDGVNITGPNKLNGLTVSDM